MFSVGDQVEVVGELNGAGQLLQDVYAEALTAEFGVRLRLADNAEGRKRKSSVTHAVKYSCFYHLLIKSRLWQQGLLFLAS